MHGWMNEERTSGRAGTPGSAGEACQGCCEQISLPEWVRKSLGDGMNGPGTGTQITGLPAGPVLCLMIPSPPVPPPSLPPLQRLHH